MKEITGGITAAKGFKAASCEAGIKYKDRTDMALIYSTEPCVCAGTFTSNVVKAAPVQWDKEIVNSGNKVHAVVVNSGIANACTGQEGMDACITEASCVAGQFGNSFKKESVLVASTGVIGMQLPVDKMKDAIVGLVPKLDSSAENATLASKAIMTTDTVNKEFAVEFTLDGKKVHIGGMTKGSGMIHPMMCTMLCFITTDAAISREMLQKALREDVVDTYNMISVDGDTSTNDTCVILANATAEANSVKASAISYTDSILASIEALMSNSISEQHQRFQAMQDSMQKTYSVVVNNRRELNNAMQSTPSQAPVAPMEPQYNDDYAAQDDFQQ
jgi:glutamate N-acetyltransferase/amino-acid N-acetyltransferase